MLRVMDAFDFLCFTAKSCRVEDGLSLMLNSTLRELVIIIAVFCFGIRGLGSNGTQNRVKNVKYQ